MTAPRDVQFIAPGNGAYRITVRGADPTSNATALSVAGEPVSLALTPGLYVAFVESLSSPGVTEREFRVDPGSQQSLELSLGGDPDQATGSNIARTRASAAPQVNLKDLREVLSHNLPGIGQNDPAAITRMLAKRADGSLASFVEAANSYLQSHTRTDPKPQAMKARAFSLGLSMNVSPDVRGGWRPAEIAVEQHEAAEGEVRLKLRSPNPRELSARRRLTVVVAGDLAWRTGLPLFPDGLWLTLRATSGPNGPDVVATRRPVNERTAVLVGALGRALPNEVTGILGAATGVGVDGIDSDGRNLNSKAMAALYDKGNDPWAAAAAALLLTRIGKSRNAIDWTMNLANRFEWLADASVAAAWAEVADPVGSPAEAEARSLKRLQTARGWGPPYFSASNALALQMLTSLALSASPEVRRGAKAEHGLWTRHGLRAIRGGAFLAWELPGNTLRKGKLPRATYNTIVVGEVCNAAVHAQVKTTSM
jgi:hypothetical protein